MRQPLNEKYRPTSPENYVFKDKNFEGSVREWIESKNIPSILFSGPPGTGKSSASRMIISSLGIDPTDVLNINTAAESRIDVVRDKIVPWIQRRGFGEIKVIVLEEFERMSPDAQKALKVVTEDYYESVRFIATSNNIAKLDKALMSRFQHFVLDSMNYDDIIDFVLNIFESEGMELANDDDNSLLSHIDAHQPDLRKIINSIDQYCVGGVLSPCGDDSATGGSDEWENIWSSGTAADNTKVLIGITENIDSLNYDWFYSVMHENIEKNFDDVASAIMTLSTYLDRATRTANHRLTMDACLYHLFFVEA